ncbi:hypothetical protein LCGC14_0581580 [marine sediment metagenome]|uniref:Uncharacterized protein n=1 Tax=marine sediment metagenome TaxID=412755 RepID=A0A0F9UPF0_9ZZZZ
MICPRCNGDRTVQGYMSRTWEREWVTIDCHWCGGVGTVRQTDEHVDKLLNALADIATVCITTLKDWEVCNVERTT